MHGYKINKLTCILHRYKEEDTERHKMAGHAADVVRLPGFLSLHFLAWPPLWKLVNVESVWPSCGMGVTLRLNVHYPRSELYDRIVM